MKLILQQPNGKHALYDMDKDDFIVVNEDYREIEARLIGEAVRTAIRKVKGDILDYYKSRCPGKADPYFSTYVGVVKEQHGDDCESIVMLRAAGLSV